MKIFRHKAVQIVTAGLFFLGIHYISTEVPAAYMSWIVSLPALAIVMVTAMARAQDISGDDFRSFIRRIGFILSCAGAFSLAIAPMLGYTNSFPSWRGVILLWGFALTWLTTPNMPPWHKYISGEWRIKKGQDV